MTKATRIVLFFILFNLFILSCSASEKKFGSGFQSRLRGDFYQNQSLVDFGYSPSADDSQFLERTRLNLSLKPYDHIHAFIEGQWYGRWGNRFDDSDASLYQGYIHILPTDILNVKVGRQDFSYGTTFFLGPNDFYEGLAWDAVKINLKPIENFNTDLIAALLVDLNKNTNDTDSGLHGLYSTYNVNEMLNLDGYFFYHKGGFQFFHKDLPGRARWYTVGTRGYGKLFDRLDYEFEPSYQFGEIYNIDRAADDRIRTYGGHLDLIYSFKTKLDPKIIFAYAYARGDNDTSNNKYEEFHGNVYNDNFLVGDMNVIADMAGLDLNNQRASGIQILTGGFSFEPISKLNLNFDYHYFTADKTPDGINDNLGSEANLVATYIFSDNLKLTASANRFFTGDFFKDASGSSKDIDYFYLQTQIDF